MCCFLCKAISVLPDRWTTTRNICSIAPLSSSRVGSLWERVGQLVGRFQTKACHERSFACSHRISIFPLFQGLRHAEQTGRATKNDERWDQTRKNTDYEKKSVGVSRRHSPTSSKGARLAHSPAYMAEVHGGRLARCGFHVSFVPRKL